MRVITTTDELSRTCSEFAAHDYVTVDTEFIRERTYFSQLCLVQLARPLAEGESGDDGAVVIDPLASGIDLAPLDALMADEGVLKVFHASRQDLEIFYNRSGRIPAPLFDTQLAAMVCGYGEQVGYETLVRKIAKSELDKSSRFTDWARRPLSEKQLVYALGDVTHLRLIYERLSARLAETGRAHWLAEELAILRDPATYENDPRDAWRRIKARSTSPKFLAVVRALAEWREATAQARNVPRSRLLKDDALLEIANARPKTMEDLGQLRLLQREARRPEIGGEILAAVAAGEVCPPEQRPAVPSAPRRKEGSAAVAELLKVFLKARADQLSVASKLIASGSDLEALAGEDDPDIPVLKGWRREVFGEDALRLREGKLGLVAQSGGVRVIRLDEDPED